MSAINIQKDLQYKQLSKGEILKISFQVLKHALLLHYFKVFINSLIAIKKYYFQLL